MNDNGAHSSGDTSASNNESKTEEDEDDEYDLPPPPPLYENHGYIILVMFLHPIFSIQFIKNIIYI